MTIQHIDSSTSGDASVSRQLSTAAVAKIAATRSSAEVSYRDLTAELHDHYVMTDKPGNDSEDSAFSVAILEEFLAADTIVIVAEGLIFGPEARAGAIAGAESAIAGMLALAA